MGKTGPCRSWLGSARRELYQALDKHSFFFALLRPVLIRLIKQTLSRITFLRLVK